MRLKKGLSVFALLCLLLQLMVPCFAAGATGPSITMEGRKLTEEERTSFRVTDENVYGLFIGAHGGTDENGEELGIAQLNTMISYDSSKIFAYDARKSAIVEDAASFSASCVVITGIYDDWNQSKYQNPGVAAAKTDDGFITVNIGCLVADPTSVTVKTEQTFYVLLFKIKDNDESLLNKGSIRIETDKENLEAVKITASIVLDDAAGNAYEYNGPRPEATKLDASAISLTFPGSDKDELTATTIVEPEGGLTLAVPNKSTGTNSITLSVTNTGLAGEYTGSENATTTWSIDGQNDTGATIDESTGKLSITNTGKAGEITVKASTVAGGETVTDTATVKITKAASVVQSVSVSGGDTPLEVPVGDKTAETTFSATVEDQYGSGSADDVTWSISPADKGVTIDDGKVTVTSGAAEYVTDTTGKEFTVTATCGGKSGTATLTVKRAASEATTVTVTGADSIEVPASDSKTSNYTAAVTDQYGAEMKVESIAWSIEPKNSTGITMENGTLTVANTAAENGEVEVTVKATVDGKSGETKVTVARAASEATTIDVTIPGTIPEIPALNQPAAEVSLTATVKDQYGAEMTDPSITWALTEAPEGVSIDQSGKVTISAAVAAGTVKFTATCGEVTKEGSFEIKRAASVATSVELIRKGSPVTDTDTLTIPADGQDAIPYTYIATVKDQYGAEMEGNVTFSLEEADDFVSISGNTVTVKPGAEANKIYTLTATVDGTEVKAQVTITVVDIVIIWPQVTTSNTVYGHKWSEIVSFTGGSATLDGKTIEGEFTLNDADAYPEAGSQSYTLHFQSKDNTYSVDSDPTTVTINKKPLANTMLSITGTYTYTGDPITPTYTVSDGTLMNSDDYGVEVTNNTDAGTATVTVKATEGGNYSGTATGTFEIAKANITGITTTVESKEILANNEKNTDIATLKGLLTLPEQVTVTYGDGKTDELDITWASPEASAFNIKGGAYTFKGTVDPGTNFNAYTPTLDATVTVTAVKATLTLDETSATKAVSQVDRAKDYAALGLPATVSVTYDAESVIEPPTYDITGWSMSIPEIAQEAGKVTDGDPVTLTLTPVVDAEEWATLGGDLPTYALTITSKLPVKVNVTAPENITYGETLGDPKAEQKAISDGVDDAATFSYSYAGVNDTEYGPSAEKPTKAGDYQVTATLVSNTHDGVGIDNFTIKQKDLADTMVTVAEGTYTYTGEAIEPVVTVSDVVNEKELITAGDYTVEYSGNVDAGEATVTVTAAEDGNYTGTATAKFTIGKASLADKTPTIVGTAEVGGVLTARLEGVDAAEYTWTWMRDDTAISGAEDASYVLTFQDSNKAITVKAVAKANGNYQGETQASAAVTVAKQAIAGTVTISEKTNVTDGTVGTIEVGDTLTATANVTPAVLLTYQWYVNGTAVAAPAGAGMDYTVAAEDAGKTITVTVTPSADYTGTVTSAPVVVGKAVLTGSVTLNKDEAANTITATVADAPEGSYDIVWLRDGVETGVTGETYAITDADKGHTITAKLTAKGDTYTGEIVAGSGVTVAATAPAAPSVTATAGDGQVTVSWTVSDNGGAAVTQYQIQMNSETPITLDAATTSYTFTGLTNDTEYTFQVKAINSVGAGDAGSAKATPKEPQAPSGGGGSSVTRYDVSAPDQVANGKLTVSPSRAARGSTVTITVTPDEGYELDTLTVTDGDGDAITLNDKGNGKFTFTMPRDDVEIDVSFRPVEEPAPETLPFTDVAEGDWYYDAVAYAWENDLMTGTSATLFAPNVTTTRAMLATLLYRLEGEPDAGSASFTDVAAGIWYSDAVAWAASEGVVNGVGDGSAFDSNGNITREQMAVMLYRYADYKGYDVTQGGMAAREYEDYGTVSSWAVSAVDWAVNAGLISGTSATTLTPQGSATRAEIATILMRFCQQFIEEA